MQIIVNGKTKEVNALSHLEALINHVCADSRHVLAELNGQIIPRTAWAKTCLEDGDKVELVSFVGGG